MLHNKLSKDFTNDINREYRHGARLGQDLE